MDKDDVPLQNTVQTKPLYGKGSRASKKDLLAQKWEYWLKFLAGVKWLETRANKEKRIFIEYAKNRVLAKLAYFLF